MEDRSCAVGSFGSSPIERLARLIREPSEAEFGRLLREECGVEDESFAAALRRSCVICGRGVQLYPSARELVISFNGGKDACVVLYLWLASVVASAKDGAPPGRQSVVFFDSADEFEEIQAFVVWVARSLDLDLVKIENRSFRDGMGDVVEKGVRAIVMGQRFGDPFTPSSAFTPSTDGWPAFMRVNPIIEWTYGHVWTFLRGFGLPYCELYDAGYTSLGSRSDTVPNPCLLRPDGAYAPAYKLQDAGEERTGRGQKASKEANGATSPTRTRDRTSSSSTATAVPVEPTLARQPSTGPAPRTAGIVLIGDELLSDKVHKTNSGLLCQELYGRGIAVRLIEVVAGKPEAISVTVRRAADACDLVFASGGVGPAHDDERTLRDVAAAFEQDHAEQALALRKKDAGHEAFQIGNVHTLPGAPVAFRRSLEGAIAAGLFGSERRWAEDSLELDAEESKISETLRRTHAEFPEVMVGAYPAAEQNGSRGRVTVDFVSLSEDAVQAARDFVETELGLR